MRNRLRALSAAELFREIRGVLSPALLAAALFAIMPGNSHSQGEGSGGKPKDETPALCGEWHRGSGESTPLDLAAVKRAYGALRERVAKSLDRSKEEAAGDLERAFDAGLPACRGEAMREERLPRADARLGGKMFYVVSVADPARLTLPREVVDDPAAHILVVRARALKDLPAIVRAAGRPVSLAGPELAKALGVRCANTWLKVSEKGDAAQLHESR